MSLRFRVIASGGAQDPFGTFTTRGSPGANNGARTWIPQQIVVDQLSLSVPAAPGLAKKYGARFRINGTNHGSVIQVSDTALNNRIDPLATLPAAGVAGLTAVCHMIGYENTGAPAAANNMIGFRYRAADPDDDLSLYGSGDDATNLTLAASSAFIGLEWQGSTTGTEGACQVAWPIAGTFKYFLARYISAATTVQSAAFRKNGADAITLAMPAAVSGGLARDDTTQVTVAAGDLVNFEFHRVSGAGITLQVMFVIGFKASHGA